MTITIEDKTIENADRYHLSPESAALLDLSLRTDRWFFIHASIDLLSYCLVWVTTRLGDKEWSYCFDTRSLSENREPTAEKPFWPIFPLIFVK